MIDASALRLVAWFRASQRDLPWRAPYPRDPYEVLVSEVMLQQTQVDRVVQTYQYFMSRFPTLQVLAAAGEDDVVSAFSGLGYYGRARHLHRAARTLATAGSWPESRQELARLPGVGSYTSAAIAAFSFAGHDPPVDGNVTRVIARLHQLEPRVGTAALADQVAARARSLYATHAQPETWEALMELGATVCTTRRPGCDACPLASACQACAGGEPEAYPRPRAPIASERQDWVAVWLEREDGSVLLRRVVDGALLAGLWLPPFVVLRPDQEAVEAADQLAGEAGHRGCLTPAPALRHAITYRRIRVQPFIATWEPLVAREEQDCWRFRQPLDPGLPTSSLLAKLARACSVPLPSPPGSPRETHDVATDYPTSDG